MDEGESCDAGRPLYAWLCVPGIDKKGMRATGTMRRRGRLKTAIDSSKCHFLFILVGALHKASFRCYFGEECLPLSSCNQAKNL